MPSSPSSSSSYLHLSPSTTNTSSTAAGGAIGTRLSFPPRNPIAFVGLWAWAAGPGRKHADRSGHVAAATAASGTGSAGEQDHYAILGLHRSASSAEIKRAFRLLARKYHPDVSKDLRAGEMFKSIRYAYEATHGVFVIHSSSGQVITIYKFCIYQLFRWYYLFYLIVNLLIGYSNLLTLVVLSDEVSRSQYDVRLRFPSTTERTWRRNQSRNFEDDEMARIHKWAQRMRCERRKKAYSWYDHKEQYHESYERGPFIEVLRFTFLSLFLMKTMGYRASLTICSLTALLDKQLDAGYKTGYIIAWFMGGPGGIVLSILIHFTSWLCGKNNSNLVAVVAIAMWIGANLASLAPLPRGAVLALLYMSIKLQVDPK